MYNMRTLKATKSWNDSCARNYGSGSDSSPKYTVKKSGVKFEQFGVPKFKVVISGKCVQCGEALPNDKIKQRHMRVAHGSMYICWFDECNEEGTHFANRFALDTHQKQHDERELKFKCNECGDAFPYKSWLLKHAKTHSASPRLHCDQPGCSSSFLSKYDLARHVKRHQSTVVMRCPQASCKYTTKDAQIMKNHIRYHDRADDHYKCDHCDFTCKADGSWYKHKKCHV